MGEGKTKEEYKDEISDRRKQYQEKIATMTGQIDDLWLLNMIIRFIEGVTREE